VVIEGPHENDEGCECFALEVEGSPRGRFDMQTAAKKAMMYSHLESKKMNKRPNLIRHMKELLGNSLLDYGNTTEDGNFTYFLRNAASIEGPREDEDGWECFDVWYAGLHRGTYNTAEVAVRVALSY
jgi:hypothetical protein